MYDFSQHLPIFINFVVDVVEDSVEQVVKSRPTLDYSSLQLVVLDQVALVTEVDLSDFVMLNW